MRRPGRALALLLLTAVVVTGAPLATADVTDDAVSLATGSTRTISYGPYWIPPATTDQGSGPGVFYLLWAPVAPVCGTGCAMTAMRADLRMADGVAGTPGTEANIDDGLMLHHVVFQQLERDDATCGRNGVGAFGERFFAAGNERTPTQLPPGYGYKVGVGSSDLRESSVPVWEMLLEVTNSGPAWQPVYVTFTADVVPWPASEEVEQVRPLWLDVDNCADSEYAVPAGFSETTATWTSNVTGRVVAAFGHVHDGGMSLRVANRANLDPLVPNSDRLCWSVAGYGNKPQYENHIDTMSQCVHDRVGVVRAGDVVEIKSRYDAHVPDSHAMGIAILYVYETSDLGGGTPYTEEPPPEPVVPEYGHSH